MQSYITIFIIIEQSSNNFWQIFGSPLATLAAVIISGIIGIILFIQGVKKERKLYEEKRLIEKNDIIKEKNIELDFFINYFLMLLNNVIENSRKQKDFIIEYANNLIKRPTIYCHPTLVTQTMTKRLLDIENGKVLKIFIEKKVDENKFIVLYSNLDYLDEVFERFQNDLNNGTPDTVHRLSNDLLKIRDEILKSAADFLNSEKYNYPEREYLNVPLNKIINELMNNYYDNNDGIPNIQRDYEMLIIPLKEKLLNDEFREKEITNVLLRLAKRSGDIIFSVNQLNTEFGNELLVVGKNIAEVSEKIEEIKNDLRKQL